MTTKWKHQITSPKKILLCFSFLVILVSTRNPCFLEKYINQSEKSAEQKMANCQKQPFYIVTLELNQLMQVHHLHQLYHHLLQVWVVHQIGVKDLFYLFLSPLTHLIPFLVFVQNGQLEVIGNREKREKRLVIFINFKTKIVLILKLNCCFQM